MRKIYSIIKQPTAKETTVTLTLDYSKRQICTQRVNLDQGEEVGLFLPRGTMLNDLDLLETEDGSIVQVLAATEDLSVATCDDDDLFARACYHLGNRHAAAQISTRQLCYQHDHVLDEMLKGLGLTVTSISAPFFPEPGAYHQQGSHHH